MVIDLEAEMVKILESSRGLELADGWRAALAQATEWLVLGRVEAAGGGGGGGGGGSSTELGAAAANAGEPEAAPSAAAPLPAPRVALFPDVRSRTLLLAALIDVDAVCALVEDELRPRLESSIAGWGCTARAPRATCEPAPRLRVKLRCEEIIAGLRSAAAAEHTKSPSRE